MGHYTEALRPGAKYNRLTVIERVPRPSPYLTSKARWYLCECECGNQTVVEEYRIKTGKTKSCGCLRSEVSRQRMIERNKSRRKNDGRSAQD